MEKCVEHTSVLQLNDDCLQQIFQKLNLHDQLILTDVCERFRYIIFDYIFKIKFRNLRTIEDDTKMLTNEQYQKLFILVTPFVHEFTIDKMIGFAFSSYLGRYQDKPELVFFFCHNMPKLRILTCYDESLHDGHIKLLVEKCPNLQVLQIFSPYVTGAHMVKLKHLNALSASKCSINEGHLSELLPQLSYLNITDCSLQPYKIIVNDNNKLTKLIISVKHLNDGFAELLGHFKVLNLLSVKYSITEENTISESSYQILGKYLTKRLRELTFINNNNDVISLLGELSTYLPILKTIMGYLNNTKDTEQIVQVKFEPKPTINLYFTNITHIPNLERLLSTCFNVSHIYIEYTSLVLESNVFKKIILKTIQLLKAHSTERQLLTIHWLYHNDNNTLYKKFFNEIIENEEYKEQKLLKLRCQKAGKEFITRPESNIDFML